MKEMGDFIIHYIKCNYYGSKKAVHLDKLVNIFEMNPRDIRRILSKAKHKGLIGSIRNKGYWYIPERIKTKTELKSALKSVYQMEKQAKNMLKDTKRNKRDFLLRYAKCNKTEVTGQKLIRAII